MKNNTTPQKLTKTRLRHLRAQAAQQLLTVGVDTGDRNSRYCIVNPLGNVETEGSLATTKTGFNALFAQLPPTFVVIEAGTHSPWISRHLESLGHQVCVANPRNVALISQSKRKSDRVDAEKLARLGRADPQLLSPIQHRSEQTQLDLLVIRSRDQLVESRTGLVNCVRGLVKPLGERLASCDADYANTELLSDLPDNLRPGLQEMLQAIEALTIQIHALDLKIHQIAQRYPEIQLITPIDGVGELTALTFLLTIEDVTRFAKSREVGAYFGLVPGQSQSGDSDPQQRITKQGDPLVRKLLVQCAHCLMRHNAADSDLRRWGMKKLEEQNAQPNSGSKKRKGKGKKRILVAIARRLAVLMHHLLATGEVYDPLYQAKQQLRQAA